MFHNATLYVYNSQTVECILLVYMYMYVIYMYIHRGDTYSNFPSTGDQMVLYYGFAHKSMKWWKRVFFHVFDLCLVNAHILYQACGNKLTQMESRTSVAESLLDGYERQQGQHSTSRAAETPLRLTEKRPFLEPTPQGSRPDCRVCSNRRAGERHQTQYRCKGCKTPLCPYPCMERYHTLKDYKIKY